MCFKKEEGFERELKEGDMGELSRGRHRGVTNLVTCEVPREEKQNS